jgi:uncharacterized membrane protein YuzA (DUF378 family)
VTPPRAPGERQGSTLRLLIGATLIIAAISGALIGFVRLIAVLEGGGYGTSAMRTALFILGTAGAMLAAGVATLIWDIAKRFESPSEPQVGDRNSPR